MQQNPFEEIDQYIEDNEAMPKLSEKTKEEVMGSYNATNFVFKTADSIVKIFSSIFGGILSFFDSKPEK